jgi:hypothetical protein
MQNRLRATAAAAGALLFAFVTPASLPAQTSRGAARSWTVAKTPWGDPDLQGFWTNTTTTPLQRPADLADKPVLTPEEYAKRNAEVAARSNTDQSPRKGDPGNYTDFWYERGALNYRTSLVIDPPDGKIPALTAEEQKRAGDARRSHGPADSPEDRSTYERCISRGLPGAMMPGFYNHNYQIVQTPGYVVVSVEMIHDARIIPVDGRPHAGAAIRNWMGDSRGHWEGNTLVVETTNFNDKVREQSVIAFSTGKNLRLVEKFTRTAENAINYEFTVSDPTVYARPWTASIPMSKFEGPIYEYACHEGNYGLGGILRGARMDERLAGESARKP